MNRSRVVCFGLTVAALIVAAKTHAQPANQATPLSDFQSRASLTEVFRAIRIPDPNNIAVYSYQLRLQSTESFIGQTTQSSGTLKIYDDQEPTTEMLRSELLMWRNGALLQRVVADGRRVWAHDNLRNEYSVSSYDSEPGQQRSSKYRKDLLQFLKLPTQGVSTHLVTMAEQIGLAGISNVKDWIGGVPFQGQDVVDPNDALGNHIFRTIWQTVPGNTRFAQFNCESYDKGSTFFLVSMLVHREENIGGKLKTTETTIFPEKDGNGVPLTFAREANDFKYRPPAGSKVVASTRTIKF
jgi:hypothetical protein